MSKYTIIKSNLHEEVDVGFFNLSDLKGYKFTEHLWIYMMIGRIYYVIDGSSDFITKEMFRTELALRKTSIWRAVNGEV